MNNMPIEADSTPRHRRSLRLREYDYSQSGAYFITVCTRNRECMLGYVSDGEMVLNDAGRIVAEEWMRSAGIRNEIELDAFVVMPNHVHGIIIINRTGDRPVARTSEPTPACGPKPKSVGTGNHCKGVWPYAPTGTLRSPSRTVGALVRAFKSACTIRINDMRDARGTSIWLRNYYEHVIRGEDDLIDIRQYILGNPVRWADDENNPERMRKR